MKNRIRVKCQEKLESSISIPEWNLEQNCYLGSTLVTALNRKIAIMPSSNSECPWHIYPVTKFKLVVEQACYHTYFTYLYVICKFVMDLAPFILFFIWLWFVCLNLLALSVVLIKWSLRCFDTIWVCLVVCVVGRPIFINSARKQEFPAKGY